MTINYDDLSDDEALRVITDSDNPDDRETATTYLEVSINGGDLDAVVHIALALLGLVERMAAEIQFYDDCR